MMIKGFKLKEIILAVVTGFCTGTTAGMVFMAFGIASALDKIDGRIIIALVCGTIATLGLTVYTWRAWKNADALEK